MCLHLGVGAGGVSCTAAGSAVGVHRKVGKGNKDKDWSNPEEQSEISAIELDEPDDVDSNPTPF